VRATAIVSVATAFVLLGASILPFLTPAWVEFEQHRTVSINWVDIYPENDDRMTESLLSDLVLWTGDFGVRAITERIEGHPIPGGAGPVALTDAERQHLRDVRQVFDGFFLVVLMSAGALAITWRRARPREERLAWWRGVRRGATGLTVAVAVLGAISIVAFDAAFEVFHRLFFAAGTYLFDPATSRLVQLFPDQFWSDTVLALGGVTIALAVLTVFVAGRRAAQASSARASSAALQVGPVAR
jgi:integral membrane protein (TIGR01906 family)